MTRRLRPYAVVAAMLALLFGVGMTSVAFACEAPKTDSSQCAGFECAPPSVARGWALACAPIAPPVLPAIGPATAHVHAGLRPYEALQTELASHTLGPEPPPPRST